MDDSDKEHVSCSFNTSTRNHVTDSCDKVCVSSFFVPNNNFCDTSDSSSDGALLEEEMVELCEVAEKNTNFDDDLDEALCNLCVSVEQYQK